MRKLEVFQAGCIRAILGLSRWDRVSNVCARQQSHQPTVLEQIRRRRLTWFGHLCRMEDVRLPHKIFVSEAPTAWKRKRGGQKKQWENQVVDDLAPLFPPGRCSLLELQTVALNRPQWNGLINDRMMMEPKAKIAAMPYQR